MTKRRGVSRWERKACLGVSLAAILAAGCGASPGTAVSGTVASGTATPGATARSAPAVSSPSAPALDGVPASLVNFFPIGAYVQPPDNFTLWKSRGINTVVEVPDGGDETAWDKAAVQDGLREIREPSSNPASDVGDKNLLAWALPDEPDDIKTQVPFKTIQNTYKTWKSIDPAMPVSINLNGQLNQYDITTKASGISWYEQYAQGANWIAADLYPINHGEGNDLGSIGQEVATLRQIAGSKPVFVFIESGAYYAGNPVITAGQLRGEVWEAIIHGARGIFYFPVQVRPSFSFDVTPAAVAAEMTAQDATITKLANVLQGTINPSPLGAAAPSPLQVAWRSSAGQSYFFVLNLSTSAVSNQAIKLSGVGSAKSATVYGENRTVPISNDTITDSFGPYAVHIYEIP